MAPRAQLLILDACVLVDFCKTDLGLLTLFSHHVGPIHVASPVFAEVEQLDEPQAISAGIRVVEPSLALAREAASRRGALSFQDWLSLLLAKERGWTCVSNDKRLRRECTGEAVATLWGLDVIRMLAEAGALSVGEAERGARAIQASNPRYLPERVVVEFVRRLRRT